MKIEITAKNTVKITDKNGRPKYNLVGYSLEVDSGTGTKMYATNGTNRIPILGVTAIIKGGIETPWSGTFDQLFNELSANFFIKAPTGGGGTNNASDLTTGTLSDARLSNNVVLSNQIDKLSESSTRAFVTPNQKATLPTPYLGQVATRCLQPNNTAGTGLTWLMTRSSHFSRDKIVNPTLVMPNYGITGGNVEQTVGAGTIKVSIEYPLGVFTLANEVIANSNNPVSFPIGLKVLTFNVTIPNGAKFWVRALQNNSNGALWHQYQSAYVSDPTEGFENGTGTPTDKTTTGSIAYGVNVTYTPVLILSQTIKPSVAIIGTSREEGGTEMATDNLYDVGLTARTVGRRFGYVKLASAGTLLNQWMTVSRTYRDQILTGNVPSLPANTPYVSHISNEYGINDIPSMTAIQVATLRTSFAALYTPNGIKVIGHTLIPYNQSTDKWTTSANQSLGSNQPKVNQFNDLVRAGISGEAFNWDVSDAVDPYRNGTYLVDRNPTVPSYRNIATFTAALSGTTLTVSAVAVGTLKVGDAITAIGVQPSTKITALGTGTGGTGTYTVNKAHSGFPYPSPIASTAFQTGAFGTDDGLHATADLSLIIRDSGKVDTSILAI